MSWEGARIDMPAHGTQRVCPVCVVVRSPRSEAPDCRARSFLCHHLPVRRGVVFAVLGSVIVAAACGGGTDAAVETVRVGVENTPVVAVIDTTTSTAAVAPVAPAAPAASTGGGSSARVDAFAQPAPRAAKSAPNLVVTGRLRIPRLGLDTNVYEGDTLDIIDHGPGHYPSSALPGRQGNVVIAGHRVTKTRPFRHLDTLQAGDRAIFNLPDGGEHVYEFTGHEIVTPDRVDVTAPTSDFRATMFACHPPGSAKYRIVAYWKLISAPVLPPPPVTTTTAPPKPPSPLEGLLGN
jgi:sortase A